MNFHQIFVCSTVIAFISLYHLANFTRQLSDSTVKGKTLSECIYTDSQHEMLSTRMEQWQRMVKIPKLGKTKHEAFRTTRRFHVTGARCVGGEKLSCCFSFDMTKICDRQLNHHNFLSLMKL